jgi:hypothetical protein
VDTAPNAHGLLSFLAPPPADALVVIAPNAHGLDEAADVALPIPSPPPPAAAKPPPHEKVPLSREAEGAKLLDAPGWGWGLGVSGLGEVSGFMSAGRCSKAWSCRPALS